jgi:hypothetical protein
MSFAMTRDMYIPVASALALIALCLAFTRSIGPCRAIWILWWPSLLLPSYNTHTIGPLELTLPSVVGAILIACAGMGGALPRKWLLSDYLMVGMIVCGGLSEILAGTGVGSAIEMARRWGFPYLLGRIALSPPDTADPLPNSHLRMVALAACGAAGLAVFESVTHVNLYWAISGYDGEYMTRYGIRRASGPAAHTIGFGMMFVCLLPWTLEAAARARAGTAPSWWRWLPWVVGAGVFCTVSRGAWISCLAVLGTLVYLQKPKLRGYLAFSLAAGAMIAWNFGSDVIDGLNAMVGNDDTATESTVYIGGKGYTYTGTNHRYIQFIAYQVPIERAGAFGYGAPGMLRLDRAVRMKEFVPGVPPNLPPSLASMDSQYLLTILQKGWIGLVLWVGLAVCAGRYLASVPPGHDRFLRHSLAGALVGVMLGLLTVYSHEPFEQAYVFMMGLAAAWKGRDLSRLRRAAAPFARPADDSPLWPPHRSSPPTVVACALDAKNSRSIAEFSN